MKFPASLKRCCPAVEGAFLAPLTTLRIGGTTPLLLEPRNREEMEQCLAILVEEGVPFRILGGGSNVLVGDEGVGAVVVCTRRFSHLYRLDENPCTLRVEAGVSLGRLVALCRMAGLSGVEGLIGIPGTVGGAVVMNAGGRHGTLGERVRRARIVDPRTGERSTVELGAADFGYRSSSLARHIVVMADLRLRPGNRKALWERAREILREKRLRQPLLARSCGCVFRNPPGEAAGRLLDAVGMKGVSRGDVVVSEVHANFFLNRGNGTARDYAFLVREARRRVRDTFGILLELEVDPWLPEELMEPGCARGSGRTEGSPG